jgi:hypothetical protein
MATTWKYHRFQYCAPLVPSIVKIRARTLYEVRRHPVENLRNHDFGESQETHTVISFKFGRFQFGACRHMKIFISRGQLTLLSEQH